MAKKIKVLDNVSGVEQIINVSSLASNGTITGSDLMLIEQSNTLKKVSITDLSAEFSGGGGGTGNYHVLKIEFEGGNEFETITELPVGSQLQQITVVKPTGLTTGTLPLTFLIDGSTPVYLATQGVEIDNTTDTNGTSWAIETPLILASGENGVFKSTFLGSGTGAGFAYLYYWTPLP
jgi:hypothetical protein